MAVPNIKSNEKDMAEQMRKLFQEIDLYRTSAEFKKFLDFARDLPHIAAYNAMLVHIQRPGSTYVATRSGWLKKGREVKEGARPLIVLKTFGPVDFVYEINDTDGEKPPQEISSPFATTGELSEKEFGNLIYNLAWDGAELAESEFGSQQAGLIRKGSQREITRVVGYKEGRVKLKYTIEVDRKKSTADKFATIAHELGHLYCGHLGKDSFGWWPDRSGLDLVVEEFEAESAAWLVCERRGIKNPSEKYMAGYLSANEMIPPIDMWQVFKAVGRIEQMLQRKMEPNKKNFTLIGKA